MDTLLVSYFFLNFQAVSLVTLKQTIQFSKCLNFLLRGFTKAGSFTVATKNIKPCDDRKYVKPRLVVDCVGESVQRDGIYRYIFLTVQIVRGSFFMFVESGCISTNIKFTVP